MMFSSCREWISMDLYFVCTSLTRLKELQSVLVKCFQLISFQSGAIQLLATGEAFV